MTESCFGMYIVRSWMLYFIRYLSYQNEMAAFPKGMCDNVGYKNTPLKETALTHEVVKMYFFP